MVKMIRSRRKSFFLANERIKRITDVQSSQSSQSTIDTETYRNTQQNRRQTQSRNTRSTRNTNNASQQSSNSEISNSQLTDENETQHRKRGKITQRRNTVIASQPTISDEPESNNNEQNQRVTQAKITQRRNTVAESQSTIAEVPSGPKKRGRQPARQQKRSADIDEPETNENRVIASAPAKVTRRRGIASQPISEAPSGPKKRGRSSARRQKKSTDDEFDERETSKNDENRRRPRSRSTHYRDTIPDSATLDDLELNKNDENQRQTRSKTAQRRAAIAARQAQPSISPTQTVQDKSKVITSAQNNNRQKMCLNKSIASKIEKRRNTIAVNDRELNDIMNFEPPGQIPQTRDFTIKLDRLDSEIINRYRCAPLPRSKKAILCNSPAARKIINRRCTVNADRTEFDHHLQHDDGIQSQPLPPPAASPSSLHSQSTPNKSTGPSVDSGLPSDRVESSDVEHQSPKTGDTTFYESDDSKMSSDISVQGHSISQSLFTHADVTSGLDGIERMHRVERNDAMHGDGLSDISSHRAEPGPSARATACTGMRFDGDADDEDSNDDASTYCPSLPPVAPINIQQMLLSQTEQYYPWNFNRSSSNNSINTMAVHYDGRPPETTAQFNANGDRSTSNKCFIDSPHVSYGKFITYGNETFAVNCLDHENQNIRHHFLSKYSSENIHALNNYFHGNLWVTEITAHLYLQYSNISAEQIKVLEYYKRTMVGNAMVTAIEAPNFPGGALFLFEAPNEKSIIHVGDLRLNVEITENEFLMQTNIDEVRFDKSMLSRVFHCFPLCTDRYVALNSEIGSFIDATHKAGLQTLIAVGAFEIGMESFLHELAISFSSKIYMPQEQRNFLNKLVEKSQNDPDDVCAQLQRHVVDDQCAMIHVLQVEDISNEKLMKYVARYNCHRVLGVRPRGCDKTLGVVDNGAHKIFDVANPLIGDVSEYERFVVLVIEKSMTTPPVPADHGTNDETARNDLQLVRKH